MTTVSISSPTARHYHTVSGQTPKTVAEMIAAATGQEAIWTGKVRGEWHVTDKRTRKVTAIIY